jgi:hypothetical protein
MANNINWGKIYGATWWGNTTNNISWGKSYISLLSNIVDAFKTRVLGLGGVVESEECIDENVDASLYLKPSGYGDNKVYAALPEDGSGDMVFSRTSEATRVNADGNIEVLSRIGNELVTNGTFETILGNELTINGDLTSDSNWNKNGVWTISGDKATSNGSSGFLQQTSSAYISGKTYYVSMEITGYVSGSVTTPFDAVGANINYVSGNLVHTNTFTAGNNGRISIYSNNFIGSVSNISVKEVIEGYVDDTELVTNGGFDDGSSSWGLQSGWSIVTDANGNKVAKSTTTSINGIFQNASLESGKTYKFSYDITEYNSGQIRVEAENSSRGAFRDSVGSYVDYLTVSTATSNRPLFRNSEAGGFNGSIDNISVKEVVQDNWVLQSGMEISNEQAIFTDVSSGNLMRQNLSLTSGSRYKVSYEIKSIDKGGIKLRYPSAGSSITNTSPNIYTEYIESDGTNNFVGFQAIGTTTAVIDNISVKEVIEHGIPRLDYTDGGCPSLLLEPESRNLITYSEDFSSLNLRDGMTVDSNIDISPEGIQNADKMIFNGNTYGRVEKPILATVGKDYTISVYLKNIDLSDVTQVWMGFSQVSVGSFVTITSEWQRYSVTVTADGATEYPRIQFTGTGSMLAYGFQVEEQSYATSYIPNHGTLNGITRLAETLERDNISHLINSEEGVLYFEGSSIQDSAAEYISIYGDNSNNQVSIGRSGGNIPRVIFRANGDETAFSANGYDFRDSNKYAIRYDSSNVTLFINSVKVDEKPVLDVQTPNSMYRISSKYTTSSNRFYGSIKDLRIYKTALTDQELTDLTTI